MPNGKTHLAITIAGAVPVSLLALGMNPALTVPTITGYMVGGLFLDPDLDHAGITSSEGRIYRMNRPFGRFYTALWHPYARMTHHRGISHIPLFGTLSRLLYLIAILVPLFVIASAVVGIGLQDWRLVMQEIRPYWGGVAAFVLAWSLADIFHIVADWIAHEKRLAQRRAL